MFRTPAKRTEGETATTSPDGSKYKPCVRRSIDRIEAAMPGAGSVSPTTNGVAQPGPVAKTRAALSQKLTTSKAPVQRRVSTETSRSPNKTYVCRTTTKDDPLPTRATTKTLDDAATKLPETSHTRVYKNRTAEAKAYLLKGKAQINNSRNLKSEIKTEVLEALERLYTLVKEIEIEKQQIGRNREEHGEVIECDTQQRPKEEESLVVQLEKHGRLLRENTEKIDRLKEALEKKEVAEIDRLKEALEKKETAENATLSYATVTAGSSLKTPPELVALHSVVIRSETEQDTGDSILEKVRKAVDAKEGWIKVEKVRKAKDRKIIMGCKTKEDRTKIKERIEKESKGLIVEIVENRDPLLILRDVLLINSDEDVLTAFRNQNRGFFDGLGDEEKSRIVIKYRKKARNPHTSHIVVSVPPIVWRRATERGTVYIDLQAIRVSDQSPLVQCSRCLGYGHSRRHCAENGDICSHCGGTHLKQECTAWSAGEAPSCSNCVRAGLERRDHSAFSENCPVRKRWDTLARSAVAYH